MSNLRVVIYQNCFENITTWDMLAYKLITAQFLLPTTNFCIREIDPVQMDEGFVVGEKDKRSVAEEILKLLTNRPNYRVGLAFRGAPPLFY